MRAFLRELTGCSPGLRVITSRERVTDLEDKLEFSVKEMPLGVFYADINGRWYLKAAAQTAYGDALNQKWPIWTGN